MSTRRSLLQWWRGSSRLLENQEEGLYESGRVQQDRERELPRQQQHHRLHHNQDMLQHRPVQRCARSARDRRAEPGPRHHHCSVHGQHPGLTENTADDATYTHIQHTTYCPTRIKLSPQTCISFLQMGLVLTVLEVYCTSPTC